MLQQGGMVMMVMKVLVMMMILMKPSSMMVTIAMISPLWEGISPADFCLPESFLSLCVFRPEFPLSGSPKVYRTQGGRGKMYPSQTTLQLRYKKSLVSPTHPIHMSDV
jgi:hypothetical protein